MAKTYTLLSYNIGTPAHTAVTAGKSMLGILNGNANRLVKVWRAWVYPSATIAAVTGVMVNFGIRRLSTLTAGTAVTPVAHNTANATSDLTTITTVTGGTAGAVGTIFDWGISTEEIAVSTATNNALLCFYPFALAWDCGVGDSNVQPITLRNGEGFDITSIAVMTSAGTIAGNVDCIIEFTVETI